MRRLRAAALALVLASPLWAQGETLVSGPRRACAGQITGAGFTEPTTRYSHAILGDGEEWGGMRVTVSKSGLCSGLPGPYVVTLPETRVFEDIAPRLADVTGDGTPELIVVETSLAHGARLAVWGLEEHGLTRLAATPFIGRPYRWLAPVGAADLDGDGVIEIALVDRPHLAMTLRVWRFEEGGLREVAHMQGVTNHRIGWDFIAGGLRDCGDGPEMVLATGDWREVVAVRLAAGRLRRESLGAYSSPDSLAAALACG